ncbi:MAG TPA: hypothetical protein VL098_07585 [Flavipsychrobacter sp.]|nr:hypothetical protein [Flavipsychrobacter sp.]
MKRYIFFILFTLASADAFHAFAVDYVFDYNDRCTEAYKHYAALRLDEGTSMIKQELSANPGNLTAVFLSDYEDFFTLLLNGDKEVFEQRRDNLDKRIALIEKGNKASPWLLATKAGVYMHWAMISLRLGDTYKGAVLFRKAYMIAKENQNKFPSFPQNKMFVGMGETVVGTLPDEYKWIASLFGMKGNVNKGLAKLTSFINSTAADELLRAEAVLVHCYLKFYLQSRQEEVWKFLNSSQFSVQNNALNAFVKANIALNYRKAADALKTLQAVQATKAYAQFPAFDYEMGNALLLQLDEKAPVYFLRFLNRDKGNLFVKDAYMQMAQSYYLQGNMQKATYYRQQIKKQGTTTTDSDKQANRFASSNAWVAVPVLKARYLIDGGYYDRAIEILNKGNPESLPTITDKLEYSFRMGRGYDELNQDAKAVQYYQATLNQGRNRKEHFAARAALQMGLMYERAGKNAEAIKMFKDCLSMRNHDFQSNIDQQAKAGLNRLNP